MKALFLINDNEVVDVNEKLHFIRAKDESFMYRIIKRKEGGYILIIYDKNKDRLHRRALWVSAKILNGRLYWTKE